MPSVQKIRKKYEAQQRKVFQMGVLGSDNVVAVPTVVAAPMRIIDGDLND